MPVAGKGVLGGVRAWEFLRRSPGYRRAWRRRGTQPGLPEAAPFPVRLQTPADLRAGRWGLLAWLDPDGDGRAVSPFWAVASMLPAAIAAHATPLLPQLGELGASITGLRLADGGLVLKIELGFAATQLHVAPDAGHGARRELGTDLQRHPGRQHDLLADRRRRPPSGGVARLRDACGLASGSLAPPVPLPELFQRSEDEELLTALVPGGRAATQDLAGRDSRDIAIELYGEETVVAAGWYPDSWVRSRIRRRIASGTQADVRGRVPRTRGGLTSTAAPPGGQTGWATRPARASCVTGGPRTRRRHHRHLDFRSSHANPAGS